MEDMESKEKQVIKVEPFNVPLIYANGVTVGLSLTDINLTANVNGRPACLLVLPLPSAKSLLTALSQAIKDYETKTGTKILDLGELSSLLR